MVFGLRHKFFVSRPPSSSDNPTETELKLLEKFRLKNHDPSTPISRGVKGLQQTETRKAMEYTY